jgi:hypothetical protein
MKIHDMFFAALWAETFNFGFVVVDQDLGFFNRRLFGPFLDRFEGDIAFWG